MMRQRRWAASVVTTAMVAVAMLGIAPAAADDVDDTTPALRTPFRLIEDRDVDDRLPQPEDRYALAGGCYAIELPGAGWVGRAGNGAPTLVTDAAAAEPLHFQPVRLGQYLLATNEGPATSHPDAWWDDRGYLGADDGPLDLQGLADPALVVAEEPGTDTEWQVAAVGDDPHRKVGDGDGQPYHLHLPWPDVGIAAADGSLALVPGRGDEVRFHLVDDQDRCATWPEIDPGTSGPPSPTGANPAAPVQGFFDAHLHLMAFEFLGGDLRCGRPWHPYGVEYALPDCIEDGKLFNAAVEVVLTSDDQSDYDPVGWPTFEVWPRHDLLTHEQVYWRWLERAHHGGLRLMTALLVENVALCEMYPLKRNSCNEMDSVRLQAQRLFELQDYIDAHAGGPGEGWFRIVTSPAQAREAINAGRLAVVLGVEVSQFLDCGEYLREAMCTADEIDERLQELHDMGVRQAEVINKFDNALSGVKGDAGATGIVVNTGNRQITGHWWDMRTCPEEASHGHHGHDVHGDEVHLPGNQHDHLQMNPFDDTPAGDDHEGAVLVSQIIDQFGDTTSLVAPVYGPGPHCNEAGLSDLGRHAISRMAELGIIFDPDHMSAAGQREALDHLQHEVMPALQGSAASTGGKVLPGVISSHSWANDVTYQRIILLGGVIAPMQATASSFVHRWVERRAWHEELAPEGVLFGLGFGADTNGFASQAGPRSGDVAQRVDYDTGFDAPIGDVRLFRQVSGFQTFDINTDGIAHYGLYADWFHELTLAADEQYPELGGGDALTADMLNGAEAFIRMWERATYGGNDCVIDGSHPNAEDIHALLGENLEGFMRAIGQPVQRYDAQYTYCVTGENGEIEVIDVEFDDDGRARWIWPHPGEVAPVDAAPEPADEDDHVHPTPPLPATGAGLASAALLLLGVAAAGSRVLQVRHGNQAR